MRLRPRATWLAIVVLALGQLARAAPPYAGQPVRAVLQELQAQGLSFIYSTALVPDTLLVEREPVASDGVALAAEILQAHALQLQRVAPQTYVVSRIRGTKSAQHPNQPDRAAQHTEIDEVVVSTSRYSLVAEPMDFHTAFSQEALSTLPRLAEEPLRAAQRLPGSASNGIAALGSMRGGEPNETLILLDGMQLYEPFHLKDFFSPVSLLDSRIISAMDVYMGGFSAKYGTRMSAVIDAHTVRPLADRYYELGASLFHTNALAAHRFANDDGSWLISARRSNLDQVARALDSNFGEPHYFDAFTRLEYSISPDTSISAAYLGSRDRVEARRPSRSESSHNEYRNNYAWATLEHEWSPRASARLIASFTDVTNDRRGRIAQVDRIVGAVDDERSFHVAGLQLDATNEIGRFLHTWGLSAHRLSASYDYGSNVRFEAGYPFPETPARETARTLQMRPDGNEYAAYWSTRWQLLPQLTTEVGVRWDDETYSGADSPTQLAPRVSAMYVLPGGQRVRLSWGRFFQAQSINEAQVENEIQHFFPAQRAEQFVASFETELRRDMHLRVEAYRKDYDNVRPRWENLFDPIVLVPELEYDRVLIDPDRARAQGIEMLLSHRSSAPWSWWLGYAWSQVEDSIDGREFVRSWNQRHAVTAGLHWTRGRWDVTVADTYHSGWPMTPVSVVGTGADARIEIGPRNSVRLDDFHALDVRINRSFPLSYGELDVFLEISNVFNESNACCIEPSATRNDDGTLILEREKQYWLGIVPSLGVLWRY